MTCPKCGYVIPEGSTVCPRCAEQESLVNEMDLELKRLLNQDQDQEEAAAAEPVKAPAEAAARKTAAEQESNADDMDLELQRLLNQDREAAAPAEPAEEPAREDTQKTIVAGASIHAAVKAAENEKAAAAAAEKKSAAAAAEQHEAAAGAVSAVPAEKPAAAAKPSGAAAGKAATAKRAASGTKSGKTATAKHTASGTKSGKTAAAKTKTDGRKQNQRRKKNSRMMTVLIAVIVAVVVAVAAVGGITAYAMKYAKYDKILPNVYIAGIDVSGLTVDEAISVVEENYGDYEQKPVEVQLPDQTLSITPAEGTVVMNPELAVSEAYNYGRGKNSPFALARAIRAAKRTENNIDITTAVTVNTDSVYGLVQEAAASVYQSLTETTIEADQNKHTITVNIGTEGRSLDTDALYELVCNAFTTGTYTPIAFDYTVEYPAAVTLDSVYDQMTVEPKNAKYNPSTGKISDAEDGMLPDTALEEANEMVASAQQGEELVFKFSKAKADYDADELEQVLFRDTLDTTTSTITDTKRLSNIEIACEALDGTVVQPGDTFSFNKALGTIGYSAGYVDADVYPGDDSDSVMGGGISQLSSALYESCLYADLQITERHAHQYLPSFAKAGLDAYVKNGDSDFAFTNTSIYPVRIHAAVSGQTLTVYLEGTDENSYEIQLDSEAVSEDPYETDEDAGVTGHDGAEYHVTRTVLDQDGKEVRKDTTEDLDAMAGCGTSVYERRDGTDYEEPATVTTDTDNSNTSNSNSGNSYNYYNYVTPVPTATTEPTTAPTTEPTVAPTVEPVVPTGGGGDTGGGDTGGGDSGGSGGASQDVPVA